MSELIDNIIILGIILSIFFYEVTEISPGGIIVPGYMALFVDNPKRIIWTIILSILCYFAVNFISSYTILYGKRKFGMFIVVSFIIRYILELFIGTIGASISMSLVIGYLVPGILAQELDRQGIVRTLSSMVFVTFSIKLIMVIYPALDRLRL